MTFNWKAKPPAVLLGCLLAATEGVAGGEAGGTARPILLEKDLDALGQSRDWQQATTHPTRHGKSVVLLYDGGQATVVCAPLALCVIQLEPGERIVEGGLRVGDAARWRIAPSVGGDGRTNLIVKAVGAGFETNLVAVTDRRTYHIRLVSKAENYMAAVSFQYQEQLDAKWEEYYQRQRREQERRTLPTGQHISALDFDYEVLGCNKCSWLPLRVYSDNTQTIIQMPAGIERGDYPALLLIGHAGEQVVNYRVVDNRYIVDTVIDQAILIAGTGKRQQKVRIERRGRERRVSDSEGAFL